MHITTDVDIQSKFLRLDPSDERWLNFIVDHPQANIFHHPAWINLLAECYGYQPFIAAVGDNSGAINAGLPVMEIHSLLTGRRWVSLPFTDYCAPLCRTPQALQQLVGQLIQNRNAPKIEARWNLPPNPAIHASAAYVLHTVKLLADAQTVAQRFRRTNRQNIQTAEKRGVRIEWGNRPQALQDFYRLQLSTRQRKGVPVQPYAFFELLWRKIIDQGLGFVLFACKDDEYLAAGLFLHYGQTLTYKYAASTEVSQNLRPNNLLTWTAIQWGCRNGYSLFDFGRTDPANEGLQQFKRGWGADEIPLTYCLISTTPPASGHSKLTPIIQTIIKNSPAWVCRATGELLYRHFG